MIDSIRVYVEFGSETSRIEFEKPDSIRSSDGPESENVSSIRVRFGSIRSSVEVTGSMDSSDRKYDH